MEEDILDRFKFKVFCTSLHRNDTTDNNKKRYYELNLNTKRESARDQRELYIPENKERENEWICCEGRGGDMPSKQKKSVAI